MCSVPKCLKEKFHLVVMGSYGELLSYVHELLNLLDPMLKINLFDLCLFAVLNTLTAMNLWLSILSTILLLGVMIIVFDSVLCSSVLYYLLLFFTWFLLFGSNV